MKNLNKNAQNIRLILIERAKANQPIDYQELRQQVGISMDKVLAALSEIDEYEHHYGHPMLCALVIKTKKNQPSGGFIQCCKNRNYTIGKEYQIFWIKRLNECHNFWADEENYLKYKNA